MIDVGMARGLICSTLAFGLGLWMLVSPESYLRGIAGNKPPKWWPKSWIPLNPDSRRTRVIHRIIGIVCLLFSVGYPLATAFNMGWMKAR